MIAKKIEDIFAQQKIETYLAASIAVHFILFLLAIVFLFSSNPVKTLNQNVISEKQERKWIKIDFSPTEKKEVEAPKDYKALATENRVSKIKRDEKQKRGKHKTVSGKTFSRRKNKIGKKVAPKVAKDSGETKQIAFIEGEEQKGKDIPIPLDTKKFEYVSYFAKIRQGIKASWHYPAVALREGKRGNTTVQMFIKRDGTLESISIYRSSGVKELDAESTRAVFEAAPFEPIPADIKQERLNVVATFSYNLGFATD